MTGKGHTWVGLATAIAVYKFSNDLGLTGFVAVLGHILGATAPDWMEIRVKSGEGMRTLIPHRTITHWLPIWLVMFYFSYATATESIDLGIPINGYLVEFIMGFAIGGLLHLLTDLPNPAGIPIISPSGKFRFSLKLWKSGKNEVAITLVGLLLSLWYIDLLKLNYYALEQM
jgi:inner membrane protein